MKLTSKQLAFAQEYPLDRNATKAAIRAGYSERSAKPRGSECYNNPEIRKLIDAHDEKMQEEIGVTIKEVVQGFLDEAKLVGEGSSHSARVAAWAHLGKYLGMFVERKEISGKIEIESISNLMDELSEGDE